MAWRWYLPEPVISVINNCHCEADPVYIPGLCKPYIGCVGHLLTVIAHHALSAFVGLAVDTFFEPSLPVAAFEPISGKVYTGLHGEKAGPLEDQGGDLGAVMGFDAVLYFLRSSWTAAFPAFAIGDSHRCELACGKAGTSSLGHGRYHEQGAAA